MNRYRVVIVDVATVIAEGVASMLSRSSRCEVLGSYSSIAEIQNLLIAGRVDIVVASVSLLHQIEECAELNNMPVVGIVSGLYEEESIRKFTSTFTIFSSTEEVERVICESVTTPTENTYSDSHELSERERDVLVLVARGLTNKEIASQLNISPHTVISHRKNIVHKTGIRSVAGLTVYAVLNKLIDSEQL